MGQSQGRNEAVVGYRRDSKNLAWSWGGWGCWASRSWVKDWRIGRVGVGGVKRAGGMVTTQGIMGGKESVLFV